MLPDSVVKPAVVAGIDDGRFSIFGALRDVCAVIAVDMAMDKVFGLITVQKLFKAGKAAMRNAVQITQIPRGCVRQQYIKALVPPKLQPQPLDAPAHLLLGIHIAAVAVSV